MPGIYAAGLDGEEIYKRLTIDERAELIQAFKAFASELKDRALPAKSEYQIVEQVSKHLAEVGKDITQLSYAYEDRAGTRYVDNFAVATGGKDIKKLDAAGIAVVLKGSYAKRIDGLRVASSVRFG